MPVAPFASSTQRTVLTLHRRSIATGLESSTSAPDRDTVLGPDPTGRFDSLVPEARPPAVPAEFALILSRSCVREGHLRIDLSCNECGADSFCLDDPASESSTIYCDGCGRLIGTIFDLKTEFGRAILRRSKASNDNRDVNG